MSSFLFYMCGDRNKASSRVRGYWIVESLLDKNNRCAIECRHSKIALVTFLCQIPFYDVIVFQKTYSRWHCLLLQYARWLNKITLLDLDDAPSRINSPVTLRNVEYMMHNVSAVTVGSQFLQEYASQFAQSVTLIPSSIRLKDYSIEEDHSTENYLSVSELESVEESEKDRCLSLGWIGNGTHYKQDLIEILKAPLTRIAQKHPVRFKLIGACGEKALYHAFSEIPGLEIDFVDSIQWSDAIAVSNALSDIDIGLYPLLPNDFNRYKCGFKALEYMAMEIPVISSDVAENREIIEHNITGLFARSENDWVNSLEYLIDNKAERTLMGQRGRQRVTAKYSIEQAAQSLLNAIQDIESHNSCRTDETSIKMPKINHLTNIQESQ